MRVYHSHKPSASQSEELKKRIEASDWHLVADQSMTFRYIALYDDVKVIPIAGERAWHEDGRTVILGMNPPRNRMEDLGGHYNLLAELDKTYNVSLAAGDTLTVKWNLNP